MKYILVIALLLVVIGLAAEEIMSWPSSGVLPTGWTQTGSAGIHWLHSNTNNAGGGTGELMFNWEPEESGTFRYYSYAFDTRKVHDMALSFKHKVDLYQGTFNLSVQISTDLNTWNTVWSTSPIQDIAAQSVTATIPWELGRSNTTYLAFVFTGDTYNLNYWWIDDFSLSYSNTLGTGLWADTIYQPVGSVIIPSDQILTIQPGVILSMASNSSIVVQGSLRAIGTAQQKISISTASAATLWTGIDLINVAATNDSTILDWCVIQRSVDSAVELENSPKVRISNCEIKNNSSSGQGGGIRGLYSDVKLYGCFITGNSSTGNGSGIFWEGGSPNLTRNRIVSNSVTETSQHGALALIGCNLAGVTDNMVLNNSIPAISGAIYLYNCSGALLRHTVANNSGYGIYVYNSISSAWLEIDHCNLVNNWSYGLYSSAYVRLKNSIIWGNQPSTIHEINNTSSNFEKLQVMFCCVRNGIYSILGINNQNYQNCITANPLFVSPTEGAGTGYDAYVANWRLQDLSPCIDAGDYLSGVCDADLSLPDIGMYARKLKPTLYSASDVSPDQGHQIDLRWYPNEKDSTWDPAAWYHVFRSSEGRAQDLEDAVIVRDPREISPELIASSSKICWIQNDRILTFLGQVKAMNRSAYSLIVPTLQDSSATGTHGEVFVVTYFDNVYFWDSIGLLGYSVDNIPPMMPTGVALSQTSGNNLLLEWNEVTEGVLDGNSYPEQNLITYLIYASDQPDFTPGPENFVTQTRSLSAVISELGSSKRFFRIVASDSQ